MASAFTRSLSGWAACAIAAAALCACGVHKPSDSQFRVASSDDEGRAEVQLDGGPAEQSAGAGGDGFELAGAPGARPARAARPGETVGGFELMAANDPAVARQAAWSSPSAADAATSTGEASVASDDVADAAPAREGPRLLERVSNAGEGPTSTTQQFKAFALWPMTVQPGAASTPQGVDAPAPAPIGLGQVLMFALCLAGAGALWTWHGRLRARAVAGVQTSAERAT